MHDSRIHYSLGCKISGTALLTGRTNPCTPLPGGGTNPEIQLLCCLESVRIKVHRYLEEAQIQLLCCLESVHTNLKGAEFKVLCNQKGSRKGGVRIQVHRYRTWREHKSALLYYTEVSQGLSPPIKQLSNLTIKETLLQVLPLLTTNRHK